MGLELARRSQCGPQSLTCGLDLQQEGWRPAPGSASQPRCRKASAVGGLHVSTGWDLAQPMPSTLLWPLHALRGPFSPAPQTLWLPSSPAPSAVFHVFRSIVFVYLT